MMVDIVEEANRRVDFETRKVFGEVDGRKLQVRMYVQDGSVVVSCKLGGEFSYSEYMGGFYISNPCDSRVREEFSSCREARSYFNELVEEHGLSESPLDEWHSEVMKA